MYDKYIVSEIFFGLVMLDEGGYRIISITEVLFFRQKILGYPY